MKLFFGILGRYIAWGVGGGIAAGAVAPLWFIVSLLVSEVGYVIASGGATSHNFASNIGFLLSTLAIGLMYALAGSMTVSLVSGLLVGAVSVGVFPTVEDGTRYRQRMQLIVAAIFVLVIASAVALVPDMLQIMLMGNLGIVLGMVVAIIASGKIADWYLAQLGVLPDQQPSAQGAVEDW